MLVLGASQQIDEQLVMRGLEPKYKDGYRITDADAMTAIMEAAGGTRTEMEANLSKVRLHAHLPESVLSFTQLSRTPSRTSGVLTLTRTWN